MGPSLIPKMEEQISKQRDFLAVTSSRKRKISVDSCLTKSISTIDSPLSDNSRTLSSSIGSYQSKFDAVDIKWAYSDSLLGADAFKQDIYSAWRIAETKLGLSPRFLEAQKMGVTEDSRRDVLLNILRWRENIGITHETLHLATYILDKCLDSVQVSKETLKDIAAASLVLASKCEEYNPLKFSNVKDIGLTSSNCLKTFGMWEKTILFEMGYRLSYPTSFMFMNYFHNCIESSLPVIQMTNYVLELSLLSTKYRDFGGAFTAHAAICLSTALLIGASCSPVLALETTEDDLLDCSGIERGSTRTIMWHLVQDYIMTAADKNDIWTEYASEQRCGVSNRQMPATVIAALNSFSNQ